MLKRILVLLDETPSSVAARRYAFQLAGEGNLDLAGLGGVDLSYIEAAMPGHIGTSAYQARLEETLKEQAIEGRTRLRATYARECDAHGVPFEWLSFDGDPIEILHLATETRDLVVTGYDTAFQGKVHEPLSEMLAKLLLATPRPLIVCGDTVPAGSDVLVGYDGSVPAMRSLQLFALLGMGKARRVHVVSIEPDGELAARRVAAATGYLRYHGCQAEGGAIVSKADPAEVLRIEVADRKITTLVMGAYGHRGFRERLFGSTTTHLLGGPPCALFVYH